jgi:cell division transport system permease protein
MNIFFLIKEGFIGLKRARFSALISIISIGLALTLLGLFALLGQNLKDIFFRFYKQIEIEAFLEPALNNKGVNSLKSKIQGMDQVEEVVYVSREEALKEFQQAFGQDLQQILTENPLPASLRIKIKSNFSNPLIIDNLVSQINALKGIQDVIYQKEIIRFLHKYFKIGVLVITSFALILLAVIIILIFNTIRLTIHARSTIIQIMRLVGATNLFIKTPFIIEGMLQGLAGGGLGGSIVILIAHLIRDMIFPGTVIPSILFYVILLTGIFLGFIGSTISVNKYLKY